MFADKSPNGATRALKGNELVGLCALLQIFSIRGNCWRAAYLNLFMGLVTLILVPTAHAESFTPLLAPVRPQIRVVSPLAGEIRTTGVAQRICWKFKGFSSSKRLRITLSVDGGMTWQPLARVKAAKRSWIWRPSVLDQKGGLQAAIRICLLRQGKRNLCGETLGPFTLSNDAASQPAESQPVTLADPGPQVSTLGTAVSLDMQASGGSQTALHFSASGLPIGLSIDHLTGRIAGTPTAVADYEVSISATDISGLSATVRFTWTVKRSEVAGSTVKIDPLSSPPRTVGEVVSYSAGASGGSDLKFSWLFGDGTPQTQPSVSPEATHRFARAGRYAVSVMAHQNGKVVAVQQFVQAIHNPLTIGQPQASTSILYEPTGKRVWNVNPDSGTVTVYDTLTRATVAEIAVGSDPRTLALAPNGRVWVANRRSASISIIDVSSMAVIRTVTLPSASQPFGLVFDATGQHVYVSLEALGLILQLDPDSAGETGRLAVGTAPRHLSVDGAGARLLVSRFITPPLPGEATAKVRTVDANGAPMGGEVVAVDTAAMRVEKTVVLQHNDTPDNPSGGRGVPNYLGAAVVSPDGQSAWVPSKQDNIMRGKLRDGMDLTFHWTTRSIASRIDLESLSEDFTSRLDFRNSGFANAALFDASGNYLFVVQETSREVAVVDAYGFQELFRIDVGMAPNGLALAEDGRLLFVHNYMDRSVSVFDVSSVIAAGTSDFQHLGEYRTVTAEPLPSEVLRGKQLFFDARDPRLAKDSFLSCGACHNDGGHDGRTWDFTGFGEGLRNTTTLEGRSGTGHGRMHWTGNFDEMQDFEGQIRKFAGGTGLLGDEYFNAGSRSQSLGDPKAGLSADLDALAAYLESLNGFAPSPHRFADGSLTPVAESGKSLFKRRKCDQCHGGETMTDSINAPENPLHDIGTITQPGSGQRLNGPLSGIDTPSLRGVWSTAPYLHDGSAATLGESIKAHDTSVTEGVLSNEDVDALENYMKELDGRKP